MASELTDVPDIVGRNGRAWERQPMDAELCRWFIEPKASPSILLTVSPIRSPALKLRGDMTHHVGGLTYVSEETPREAQTTNRDVSDSDLRVVMYWQFFGLTPSQCWSFGHAVAQVICDLDCSVEDPEVPWRAIFPQLHQRVVMSEEGEISGPDRNPREN